MSAPPAYCLTEAQARRRAKRHEFLDPLPKVFCALLNGLDIDAYVRHTGMVHPFQSRLKTASCEIPFLGKVIESDGKGGQVTTEIAKDTVYVLRKNSIIFVNLSTLFLLPRYIAARFNLQIRHVHKGLLLGTGPLVDPGFNGQLLVPLHNLTSNECTLVGGEPFIWVEFTKLSRPMDAVAWQNIEVPQGKTAAQYLLAATGGNAPGSSIPESIRKASIDAQHGQEAAKAAQIAAESAQRSTRIIAWVGVVGVLIGLAGLFFNLYQIHQNSLSVARELQSSVAAANAQVADLRAELSRVASSLETQSKEVAKIKAIQQAAPDATPPPQPHGKAKPAAGTTGKQ